VARNAPTAPKKRASAAPPAKSTSRPTAPRSVEARTVQRGANSRHTNTHATSPRSAPQITPMRVVGAPRQRMDPAVRRDLIVVFLIVLAILTAGALIAGDRVGVLDYWRRALTALFGWGAVIVPAVMLVWAWDSLLQRRQQGTTKQVLIGSALMLIAILGLLHALAADPLAWAETGRGGGYSGYVIDALLVRLVGTFGAAVVLAGMFLAGLAVFMNQELRAAIAYLRSPAAPAPYTPPPRPQRSQEYAQPMHTRVVRDLAPPTEYDIPPQSIILHQTMVRPPIARPPETLAANESVSEAERSPLVPHAPYGSPERPIVVTPTSEPVTPAASTVMRPTITGRELPPLAPRPEHPVAPESSALSPPPPPLMGASKLVLPPPPDEAAPRWTLPSLARMERYPEAAISEEELEGKARVIEKTLASFKVEATVREINPGPAITQYALEPGVGVKVRRVTELQNDLALALAVPALRIEAPVPGKSRIGIEIPNVTVSTVGLRAVIESPDFTSVHAILPVPLGRDVNGRYQVADLARMPHLLIAGTTGSGKSAFTNSIISTLLLNRTPDELRMVLVDPKMVEMSGYNGIPHLLAPVVTDMEKVIGILRWAVTEMERRYQLLMRTGVRDIRAYHKRALDLAPALEKPMETLPYVVIIIDELADLMMTAPDDIETALVRLAQKARATGIHLVLATQRPSVDVITGLIKANFPARVAFAVTSQVDSRVILDMPGAERLLGRGDMLYKAADSDKPARIQGPWVSDADIERIVAHWRLIAPEPQYQPEVAEARVTPKGAARDDAGADGNLIDRAREIVREQGWASTSNIQRRLRIGYNRAARLVEALEREGLIGTEDDARRRPMLDVTAGAQTAAGETPEATDDGLHTSNTSDDEE